MRNNRGRTHVRALLILLLAIIFAIIVIGLSYSGGRSAPELEPAAPLKARVLFDGRYFNVGSNDPFDWKDCVFTINPQSPTGGFSLTAPLVGASQMVRLDSPQFAQSDGRRFDLMVYKPTEFAIQCNTPRGRASYFGSFH